MTADTVGGVWTYALELGRALVARGIDVHLATEGRPLSPDQREQLAREPGITLHESEFRLEWMSDPWTDVDRAGQWLLDLETVLQPDVVHLNSFVHGALEWDAPVLVVGHSCVLSWWQAVHGTGAPAYYDGYRDRVRTGLLAADAVVTPTQAMARCLERHYGPLPDVGVIPNGRDPHAFQPGRKEQFIFAAGRVWDAAKNLAVLGRAAEGLDWPVVVAGETSDPDGRAITVEGAHAIGPVQASTIAEWYACAAIYALPARYEPFGLTVLEAALCGCALVLGDIESLREIWDEAAVFVTPDDPDELRHTLHRLTRDESARLELAARARDRAIGFDPDTMAKRYTMLYGTLRSEHQEARLAS